MREFARAQWVEAQKVYVLPIPYFHVVFTTDHAINAWVPANQKAIYTLLFETAAAVLKQFATLELRCHTPGYTDPVGVSQVIEPTSAR